MEKKVEDLPIPGQIAVLRQRTYLVESVVAPKRQSDCSLVRLSCVDDDNQGNKLEVLWERELAPRILNGECWDTLASKGFDNAEHFAAYLNTLKWNCVTSTDPQLFQSPFRAGIRLDAYQLEPLRKALKLPRVNLFIADDVGLGKTIEAGLIARELLIRKKIREIYVSCPPSMLFQWKEELEARFGLTFQILDKEYLRRVRSERGFGINPWSTHSRFLVSHRLLIDETYVGPLRDHLGALRSGSLFILDEAHHAAPASGAKYAIDSKITRSMRDLASRFEHRLFLSATPHNGHSNSFSALLEILDPQRFCRGVPVAPELRDEVVVRRIKEDIRAIQGGFPVREVVEITVGGLPETAPELVLSELLNEYREVREERLSGESRSKQAASGLIIVNLQKRLLSSIEAFARTLKVHRQTIKKQLEKNGNHKNLLNDTSGAYIRSLDLLVNAVDSDDERSTLEEEILAAEEEAQVESASEASLGPVDSAASLFEREQQLLDEMSNIAEKARGETDARTEKLIGWIQQNMCPDLGVPGAKWNGTRVLIFTEYDDTKRYLVSRLQAAIEGSELAQQRVHVFHGPTPQDKREDIKRAFNSDPASHPLRILVATDAAREGLNLQARCHNLFHFDVPWNPSRMEQRNGRIDRKLQPEEIVYCHYFVYTQRKEDRILETLVRKTETIKNELGSLSQVIDSSLTKVLKGGIHHKQVEALNEQISQADIDATHKATINEELEGARQRQSLLREQIDKLRTQLENSKKVIGFDDEQFRSAISCSLELLGAERLKQVNENGRTGYIFPSLDQRTGADPTWAATMDTLRAPRKRDQKLFEWRRSSPIRPIVFEDQGIVGRDAVHLHLEQKVAQRLLSRFTAQGYILHDLSRACFAQASDAIPRVLLLARLSLYGEGAARLHEELIPITARWVDPAIRKEPLKPYAKDTETKTLSLLDDSLLEVQKNSLTDEVTSQLQTAASQDIKELMPYLEKRGEEYAAEARMKLDSRGQAEGKAMKEILEAQRKYIVSHSKKVDKLFDKPEQQQFDFGDILEEKAQLETNRRYWAERLESLKGELATEPNRIEEIYKVRAQRIEPIGIVYLWPITG